MHRPPLVLSLQSQVVLGHVGNSAAVFPMMAAGLEVAPIPTVLYSNTPFYPTLRGTRIAPDLFADLLRGAEERGLPERAAFVITGYMASVEVAELAAAFVARAKAANPGLVYLCDPVMGDTKPGLYVPETIAHVIRDRLLPMADIATPNPFEVGYLSGLPLRDLDDLARVAAALPMAAGARLIATGCAIKGTPAGQIETLVHGPEGSRRFPVALQDAHLSGTGDLFASLLVTALACGTGFAAAIDWAQAQMSRAIAHAIALGKPEVSLADPAFRAALLAMGATAGPSFPE